MKKFIVFIAILLTIFAFVSCNGDTKAPKGSSIEDYQTEADKALVPSLVGRWESDLHYYDVTPYYEFSSNGTVKYKEAQYGQGSQGPTIVDVTSKYAIIDGKVFISYAIPSDEKTQENSYSIKNGNELHIIYENYDGSQSEGVFTSKNNKGLIGTWEASETHNGITYLTKSVLNKDGSGQSIGYRDGKAESYMFFSFTYTDSKITFNFTDAYGSLFQVKDSKGNIVTDFTYGGTKYIKK